MNTSSFFEYYYNNAQINAIIILNMEGLVLDINRAFTKHFGYEKDEIRGKHFRLLFLQKDNEAYMPKKELETVLANGQSHDENYIVGKNGKAIWCTGESVLVRDDEDRTYVVKDIVTLQSTRQLQLFLKETDVLLDRIFDSSKDIPMLILDGSMKIEKANDPFLELFEIDPAHLKGNRLADLGHPFWSSELLKNEVRRMIMNNEPSVNKDFPVNNKSGATKIIRLSSKIIDRHNNSGRRLFIIVEDVTPFQPANVVNSRPDGIPSSSS